MSFCPLSIRRQHVCGLDEYGLAHCTGNSAVMDTSSMVGVGPLDLPPNVAFSQLAAGDEYTCGIIAENATVVCVGANAFNQSSPPHNVKFTQLSSGGCGVTTDGSANCWGRNAFGSKFPPIASFYRDVAYGWKYSCVITTDFRLQCWTNDATGAAAHGNNLLIDVIPSGLSFSAVSISGPSICAMTSTQNIMCFGNETDPSALPSPPSDQRFWGFDMTDTDACGILHGGEIYCWGSNMSKFDGHIPAGTWKDVSVGKSVGGGYACAISSETKMECFGPACSEPSKPCAPTMPPDTIGWEVVSVGTNVACGTINSVVQCWDSSGPLPSFDTERFSLFKIGPTMACGIRGDNTELSCYSTADAKPLNIKMPDSAGNSLKMNDGIACVKLHSAGWVCVTDSQVKGKAGGGIVHENIGALAPQFYARIGNELQHCGEGVFSNSSGSITPLCSGHCPSGASQCLHSCPAGFACPNALSSPVECSKGHYCPVDTMEPIQCHAGRFGNATQLPNSSCSGPCPAGYWCDVGTVEPSVLCSAGHYCPEGTTERLQCPAGRYGSKRGYATYECEALCPAGYQCPVGAESYLFYPCTAGKYCPSSGSIFELTCPQRHFCPMACAEPVPCSAGRYGNMVGQRDSTCNGACRPGFFCPEGSLTDIETNCPPSFYCLEGAEKPLQCEEGFFCPWNSVGPNPFQCGARSLYCPTGRASPIPVSEGYYGDRPRLNTTAELMAHTQTNQTICETGHFCDGSGLMKPCVAGTYANDTGMVACQPCPIGSYSLAAASGCTVCTSGRYAPRTDTPCQDCDRGKYSLGGASVCSDCEVGTASNETGRATPCPSCVLGVNYQDQKGRTECIPCSPPSYSPNPSVCLSCSARVTDNGTRCDTTACPDNTERSITDQICVTCELGKYSVSGGECTTCPVNTFTPHSGSGCISCLQAGMEGIVCSGGFASVKSGYWAYQKQDPTTSLTLYYSSPCPNGFCPGSALQNKGGGGAGPDPSPSPPYDYCQSPRLDSASNIMCGECMDGYIPWGDACAECESANGGLIFGLILLSFALASFLIRSSVSTTSAGGLVVLLYFMQTAALQVGDLSSLVAWISFVNFDALFAGKKQCITNLSPYDQTLFAILTPLLLGAEVAILAMVHWMIHRYCVRRGVTAPPSTMASDSGSNKLGRILSYLRISTIRFFLAFEPTLYLRSFLSVLLFCYTAVSLACFQYLRCVNVGGESRLFSSPSVDCNGDEYHRYLIPVLIILAVYVIAFPAVITIFLFSRRHHLLNTPAVTTVSGSATANVSMADNDRDSRHDAAPVMTAVQPSNTPTKADASSSFSSTVETPFSRRWGPLYAMYESRAWYWQAFVLVRRAYFTLSAVLLISDNSQRNLWFNLLNIASLLTHIYTHPFTKSTLNHAEAASHALLLIISTLLAATSELPSPTWLQILLFFLIIPPIAVFAVYIAYHRVLAIQRAKLPTGIIDDGNAENHHRPDDFIEKVQMAVAVPVPASPSNVIVNMQQPGCSGDSHHSRAHDMTGPGGVEHVIDNSDNQDHTLEGTSEQL